MPCRWGGLKSSGPGELRVIRPPQLTPAATHPGRDAFGNEAKADADRGRAHPLAHVDVGADTPGVVPLPATAVTAAEGADMFPASSKAVTV